jgi:predicted nuclease of restriction endonuclease-like (RecB) superfamily
VVEKRSADIEKRLGITEGFSSQNLWYMRQFFLEYKDDTEQLQMAGMIPWGQNILIISKVKDNKERKYYLQATANMGWSRSVLLNQKKANAYKNHKVTPKATQLH